jgi:hypothetical protein
MKRDLLRDLLNDLIACKVPPLRKPLMLRGARQVSKSWLIEEFKNFDTRSRLSVAPSVGPSEAGFIHTVPFLPATSFFRRNRAQTDEGDEIRRGSDQENNDSSPTFSPM